MARLSRIDLVRGLESGRILTGERALAAGAGMRYRRIARQMIQALRESIYVKWQAQMHDAELREPGEPPTSKIEPVPYEW